MYKKFRVNTGLVNITKPQDIIIYPNILYTTDAEVLCVVFDYFGDKTKIFEDCEEADEYFNEITNPNNNDADYDPDNPLTYPIGNDLYFNLEEALEEITVKIGQTVTHYFDTKREMSIGYYYEGWDIAYFDLVRPSFNGIRLTGEEIGTSELILTYYIQDEDMNYRIPTITINVIP